MSEIEWERRLQKRLAYDREILGKEDGVMAYGYCPRCGSRGKLRERRPDGNDVCEAGHVYPSREATGRPRADALEAMRAEVERLTRERDAYRAMCRRVVVNHLVTEYKWDHAKADKSADGYLAQMVANFKAAKEAPMPPPDVVG